MRKSEKNKDQMRQQDTGSNLQGGQGTPKIPDLPKASTKQGDQTPGVKPRASGRQGSIDVQDGGQDVGSSAGSH